MSPDQEEIVFRLCIILCQFIPAKIDRLFVHCRGLSELFDKIHYGAHCAALHEFSYESFDHVPAKELDRRNHCDW